MARIKGLDRKPAGLFTRLAAHHIRLLRAMGEMEMGQAAAHVVLRYAAAMTATPVEVADDFNHAFEIEAEGFSEGPFCPMPERSTGRTGKC